LYQ
jgi:hypothetical protein